MSAPLLIECQLQFGNFLTQDDIFYFIKKAPVKKKQGARVSAFGAVFLRLRLILLLL
jgi:hypothetical protein